MRLVGQVLPVEPVESETVITPLTLVMAVRLELVGLVLLVLLELLVLSLSQRINVPLPYFQLLAVLVVQLVLYQLQEVEAAVVEAVVPGSMHAYRLTRRLLGLLV